MLSEAFRKYDPEGSGLVSPADFREALSRFGVKRGVNPIIRRFQDDTTGSVSYQNFLQYFEEAKKPNRSVSTPTKPAAASPGKRLEAWSPSPAPSSPPPQALVFPSSTAESATLKVTESPAPPSVQSPQVKRDVESRKLRNLGATPASSVTKIVAERDALGNVLREADTSKSGLVDAAVFAAGLERFGASASDSEVRALMRRAQTSDGSQISYAQFLALLPPSTTVPPPSAAGEPLSSTPLIPVQSGALPETPGSRRRHWESGTNVHTPSADTNPVNRRSAKLDRAFQMLSNADSLNTGMVPAEVFVKTLRSINPAVGQRELDNLVSKLRDPTSGTVNYRKFLTVATTLEFKLGGGSGGGAEANASDSPAPPLTPSREQKVKNMHESGVFVDGSTTPTSPTSGKRLVPENVNVTAKFDETKKRDVLSWDRRRSMTDDERRVTEMHSAIRDKVYGRSGSLVQIFRSFDEDGNGTVDRDELRNGLFTLGLQFNERDFDRLYRSFDNDGSGAIDYEEFAVAVGQGPAPEPTEYDLAERRAFTGGIKGGVSTKMEKDKSDVFFGGDVTEKEEVNRRSSIKINYFKNVSSREVGLEQSAALNDDVAIRLLREQIMDKAERKTDRIRDLFLDFDANGDGVVSYDEFRTGLRRLGVNAPDSQIDTLIRMADTDGNGDIDYSEFVDMMKFDRIVAEDPYAQAAMKKRIDTRRKMNFPNNKGLGLPTDVLNQHPELPRRDYEFASQQGTYSLAPLVKRQDGPVSSGPEVLTTTDKKDLLLRRKIMEKLYGRSEQMRDMFRLFDENGDGQISYPELRKGLDRLGVELTIPEFERLVTYLDADKSGTIEYGEFANLVRPTGTADSGASSGARVPAHLRSQLAGAGGQLHDESDGPMRRLTRQELLLKRKIADRITQKTANLRQVFQQFDADGNGTLDLQEFRAGLDSLGLQFSDAEFKSIVDVFDEDGSGTISYDEFAGLITQDDSLISSSERKIRAAPSSALFLESKEERRDREIRKALQAKLESKASSIQQMFRDWDENGDGVVSKAEFMHGVARLGVQLSEEEVDRVIRQCDVDGNGTIDLPEFAKYFGGNAELPVSATSERQAASAQVPAHLRSHFGFGSLGEAASEEEPQRIRRRGKGAAPGAVGDSRGSSVPSSAPESPRSASVTPPNTDAEPVAEAPAVAVPTAQRERRVNVVEPVPSATTSPRVDNDGEITAPPPADQEDDSPSRSLHERRGARSLEVHTAPDPLVASQQPAVIERATDAVAKTLKAELVEVTENHPSKLREAFRALDRQRSGALGEKEFRAALRSVGVRAPEWVLDRAVHLAKQGETHDYDRFLKSLGFDLLHDEKQFYSGVRDMRRAISSTSEGGYFGGPPASPQEAELVGSHTLSSPRYRHIPTDSGDIIGHRSPVRSNDFPRPRKGQVDYSPTPSDGKKTHPLELAGRCTTPTGKTREQTASLVGSQEFNKQTVVSPTPRSAAASMMSHGKVMADHECAHKVFSKARSQARIEDAFNVSDVTGTGVVTHQQFETGLQRLGVVLSADKVTSLLHEFDPHGQGRVDYREFAASVVRTELENSEASHSPHAATVHTRFESTPSNYGRDMEETLKAVPREDKIFQSKGRVEAPTSSDATFPRTHTHHVETPLHDAADVIRDRSEENLQRWMFDRRKGHELAPASRDILSHPVPESSTMSSPRSTSGGAGEDALARRIRDKIYQAGSSAAAVFRALTRGTDSHVLRSQDVRESFERIALPLTEGQAQRVMLLCGSDPARGITLTEFCSAFEGTLQSPLGGDAPNLPQTAERKPRGFKNVSEDPHWGPYLSDTTKTVTPRRNQSSHDLIGHTDSVVNPPAPEPLLPVGPYQTLTSPKALVRARTSSAGGAAASPAVSAAAPASPAGPIWAHDSAPPSEPLPPPEKRKEIGVVVERARPVTPQPVIRTRNDWRSPNSTYGQVRFSTPPPAPRRNPLF